MVDRGRLQDHVASAFVGLGVIVVLLYGSPFLIDFSCACSAPGSPQVSWEWSVTEDGVVVVHNGGDTVRAARLGVYVGGEWVGSAATLDPEYEPADEIRAGDRLRVPAETGTVRLVSQGAASGRLGGALAATAPFDGVPVEDLFPYRSVIGEYRVPEEGAGRVRPPKAGPMRAA